MKSGLSDKHVENEVGTKDWDKRGTSIADAVAAGSKEEASDCKANEEGKDKAEDNRPYHSSAKGSEEGREELPQGRGEEKAIVVYVEKGVQEIASAMGELNLKREAMEELESSVRKKRRVCDSGPQDPKQISTFARYLRRTKTKARRMLGKKGSNMEGSREGKEKEKGGRRNEVIIGEAEGMGGWPQTAPMEP